MSQIQQKHPIKKDPEYVLMEQTGELYYIDYLSGRAYEQGFFITVEDLEMNNMKYTSYSDGELLDFLSTLDYDLVEQDAKESEIFYFMKLATTTREKEEEGYDK